MILTPLDAASLPWVLDAFAASLHDGTARRLFARIGRPGATARASGAAAAEHHRAALAVIAEFGIATAAGPPADGFSWDGQQLRIDTEAYVLLHEVAHYQLAAPARRSCVDFGLGAGPETGDRAAADRAASVFGIARETEEALASLLGIAWEAALGHPALASFLDQNWLEGAGRPSTARYFEAMVARLCADGFLDAELKPTRRLRTAPDPSSAVDGVAMTAPRYESALRGPA